MLILADLGHDPKHWPSEAATAADKAFLVSPRNHRWRRVAVKPDINENLPHGVARTSNPVVWMHAPIAAVCTLKNANAEGVKNNNSTGRANRVAGRPNRGGAY